MRLTELLSAERVAIEHGDAGAKNGTLDKGKALRALAAMLAAGANVAAADVERVLKEREQLQSTGIGDGVAIPHGALPQLVNQCASLLIVPDGLDFAAIDNEKVQILFAVIGPKRATGEHLKTLARVSRLLRNKTFRDRLIASPDSRAAFDLIEAEETEKK
jgi:PTS system nitrogen regulatory IIA component